MKGKDSKRKQQSCFAFTLNGFRINSIAFQATGSMEIGDRFVICFFLPGRTYADDCASTY